MERYRIKNWKEHYENNRTKELINTHWVPIPNRMDNEGYTELVDHPNAAAHLGAWVALLQIASRQKTRGTFPWDKVDITRVLARISRLPVELFNEVLPRLESIGWIECFEQVEEIPHPVAGIPHPVAPRAHARKGTEGNRTEQNRTENRRRQDLDSTLPVKAKPSVKDEKNDDDDKPKVKTVYATEKDELAALILCSTGEHADRRLLDEVCCALETRGGTLRGYLDDIGPRLPRLHGGPRLGFFLSHARATGTAASEKIQPISVQGGCCRWGSRSDGSFCPDCDMGRDLIKTAERLERQKAASV